MGVGALGSNLAPDFTTANHLSDTGVKTIAGLIGDCYQGLLAENELLGAVRGSVGDLSRATL